MSREKEFSKNLIILSIGTLLPKLAYFVTLPILTDTRYVTKAEYGVYDLIVTCVSFLLPLITLQLQAAAFRFLIDYRKDKEKSSKIISTVLMFTLICAIVMCLVLIVTLKIFEVQYALLICVYFFIEILLRTIQQIVRGIARNGLYTIGTVSESILNLLLVVCIVLFNGKGLFGVLLAVTIADTIEILILIFGAKLIGFFKISNIDKNCLKELLKYSWPMVPNNLCIWVINFSDRYLITFFMGTANEATYAAATKIPSMLTIIQTVFMYAWQENAAVVINDDDAHEYFEKMFEKIFNVLCGGMAVIIAMTPILFFLLIKGDYQESYNHIAILLMSELFHGISIFAAGIYLAQKRSKEIARTAFVSMLVNVVIDVLFINFIGIYAASFSTLISYIFIGIFRLYGASKYSGMKINIVYLLALLLVEIVFCGLNYINVPILNWINAIVCIIFAIVLNRKLIKDIFTKGSKILFGRGDRN